MHDENARIRGFLVKTDSGRWAIEYEEDGGGEWEITSGEVFEYNLGDGWKRTRMEHARPGGYYPVDGATLHQGLPARIPRV
jgi:hypothetical protein